MNTGRDTPVALITGGVRGVGAGLSRAFLRAGYIVVACARRDADAPITEGDTTAQYLPCDVRREDQVAALVADVVDRYGRLDAVVNNAGGAPFAMAADASAEFHRKVVELNLLAPLIVAREANAVMQQQPQGGSITMISSVSARRPSPGTAAYGAAKAGLDSLTTSLAVEWAPKVRVNSVIVGMVETEQADLFYGDADSIAAISQNVPLGRLAKPADVGWATAFLASDAASYISGASLEVHGGGEPPHYLSTTTADIKK